MKLLHLDSSVLGDASVSRQLTAAIVARQRVLHPDLDVTYHDLAVDPALHLTGGHMAVRMGVENADETLTDDLLKGNAYLDELIATDVLVVGVPMYNFSIPTPLKAWIDRIAVAGRTFSYGANGPEGLLRNKKAYLASARGSVYAAGTPYAAFEHQESYVRGVLAFLGVTDVTVVRAEGVALGPEAKAAAIANAQDDIAAITA